LSYTCKVMYYDWDLSMVCILLKWPRSGLSCAWRDN